MIKAVYQTANILCGGRSLHKSCIQVVYTQSALYTWYKVEAKPSHYLILLVTCSESMRGEGYVSGIMRQILQQGSEPVKEH